MKFGRFFQRGKASEGTGSVFRGMFTLALGSGAARLISIAVIPVLSRIYAPEDYGVLSVFIALTAILAPLLSLRYVTALPLPRHPGLAMSLFALCVGLMALNVVIITLALWAFGPFLLGLFSTEILAPYWWLIALCLLGTAAYEIMTMWATRRRAYRHIAQTQFTQSLLGALAKVGLGLLGVKPLGLLIGQTIGVSAGTGSLLIRFREEFRENARFITRRNIARVAAGYRTFPIYRLPSQFLLAFSIQSPMLFTAAMYDAATTGQLGMAIMALTIPMNLIGQSLSRAYYAEISGVGKRNFSKVYDITRSVIKRLSIVSAACFVVIFFLSEPIFTIALGEKWRLAGELSSIMALYVVTQLVSAPLMQALSLLNKNGTFLMFNVSRSLLTVLSFTVPHYLGVGIHGTIWIYSIILGFQRIWQIIVVMKALKTAREISPTPADRKEGEI